jgi:23S rRNA (uracil1939-C5)-methyltransferase
VNRGDEVALEVTDVAVGGKSLGRIDGLVVFVPGLVPGDVARVRIHKVKRQHAEGEALELLKWSDLRESPPCRYFGTCGGCRWQQVKYDAQLEFKRRQVRDALERIGGFDGIAVNEVIGSETPYYYRNKMEFSFGERWLPREAFLARSAVEVAAQEPPALGLHIPERFDKVLDIDECWLQSLQSNGILNAVRTFAHERGLTAYSTRSHTGYLRNLVIREGRRTGETMVNLVTSEDRPDLMQTLCAELLEVCPSITTIVNNITTRKSQVAVGDYERVYYGPGQITEKIGTLSFRISANSFFQTNTEQAERLYETTKRMARLQPDDHVFDLYSGTGTIALFLADSVAEVVGIDVVEAAILDARRNAEMNGVANCRFELGDLKEKLTKDRGWLESHPPPTVVVIDPPRSGMHEKVVQELLSLGPRRMVYVSCNPSTQARDLKILCRDNAYCIEEVQPVDMFPHTEHIECVVAIRKSG